MYEKSIVIKLVFSCHTTHIFKDLSKNNTIIRFIFGDSKNHNIKFYYFYIFRGKLMLKSNFTKHIDQASNRAIVYEFSKISFLN